jgi:pimeloyl-ACP methyl ester carboxylesterase
MSGTSSATPTEPGSPSRSCATTPTGSVARRLEAEPVVVEVTDSNGQPGTVRFDGDVITLALFGALYQTDLIPLLPGVLDELDRGEGFEEIASLILDHSSFDPSRFSHGMYLSGHCQDEAALSDAGKLTRAERSSDYLQLFARNRAIEQAQCEAWDVGRSPRRERKAVRSAVPTLILVGEYDPTTPPADGRLAAETLSNSYFFELPGIGHDATALECPRLVRNRFLDDPSTSPDHRCLEDLGPPSFESV